MNWLARQPLARVAAIALAWPLLLPTALYLAVETYIRWRIWRDSRGQGGNFYWIRVDFSDPGGIALLVVPPIGVLLAWWVLRRHP